jgi:hypothetical protein
VRLPFAFCSRFGTTLSSTEKGHGATVLCTSGLFSDNYSDLFFSTSLSPLFEPVCFDCFLRVFYNLAYEDNLSIIRASPTMPQTSASN